MPIRGKRRQSAASVTERVSALTALWREKIYPGDVYSLFRSCQKSQGLQHSHEADPALQSSFPEAGLQDKLTQSPLSTHTRPCIPVPYLTKLESTLTIKIESASSIKILLPVSFQRKLTNLFPRKTRSTV